ncbi:hypothetical protein [Pseudohoeflea coraliihabitans]|uniref:Uncharacterized protein n=1 Tax=Pseudohoeflea coraliihabitans TaxID=2860393 RepID=A0ABS6WNQ1_9HYPH|nr:hypothetical protein [Pseudohoeflea sp. DP4N28-3]MBW3097293.1 hypothetical protein [Pseudohoeflea sp. DP4N28-3]
MSSGTPGIVASLFLQIALILAIYRLVWNFKRGRPFSACRMQKHEVGTNPIPYKQVETKGSDMNTLIKIAAASAFALSAVAPALADSSGALDTTTYWEENAVEVDPGVYRLMYDADNKMMRSDDDFAAMWAEATEEEQTAFRTSCAEWEKDNALFSDRVRQRCEMAAPYN